LRTLISGVLVSGLQATTKAGKEPATFSSKKSLAKITRLWF